MSLNAIATPPALEPGPLVIRCRSLTVAKVDSIVSGAQVDPVLRGVVVERQQHVDELGDLGDCLGPLGAVVGLEGFDRLQGVVAVLGVIDFGERGFGTWVRRLRQGGKNVIR